MRFIFLMRYLWSPVMNEDVDHYYTSGGVVAAWRHPARSLGVAAAPLPL